MKKNKTYFEVTVHFQKSHFVNQSIIDLNQLTKTAYENFSCIGVLEYDLQEIQVDEILGEDALCGGNPSEASVAKIEASKQNKADVIFSFNQELDAILFVFYLVEYDLKKLILNCTIEEKEIVDWNIEWKKNYKRIEINNYIEIIPEWEEKTQGYTSIRISPGQGFGTGSHETTQLCLQIASLYQDVASTFHKVLDFGCGSGILGIYSALVGNKNAITFCDIDSEALDNTRFNIKLNNVKSSQVNIVLRENYHIPKDGFDLVYANILAPILIQEKNVILGSINKENKDAILIISGILHDQENEIIKSYQQLRYIQTFRKGDWSAILFKNNLFL